MHGFLIITYSQVSIFLNLDILNIHPTPTTPLTYTNITFSNSHTNIPTSIIIGILQIDTLNLPAFGLYCIIGNVTTTGFQVTLNSTGINNNFSKFRLSFLIIDSTITNFITSYNLLLENYCSCILNFYISTKYFNRSG